MRNKLEPILLSLLLGLSILLGLSFWLNTYFGFNMFLKAHWNELARLQATNTPVNNLFYISIGIAIFLFLAGLVVINIPVIKNKIKRAPTTKTEPIKKDQPIQTQPVKESVIGQEQSIQKTAVQTISTPMARPPRLNLPKNMAEIVSQKQNMNVANPQQSFTQQTAQNTQSENPYNPILAKIFTDAGYTIKPNPVISGFIPNVFAIGTNEVVWIGGIDCKIDDMLNAVKKLNGVFEDTLSDIPIDIHPFIVDNLNTQVSDDSVLIFHSIDELKKFMSENPAGTVSETTQEEFNSYSEYIDTIIQYIKNV